MPSQSAGLATTLTALRGVVLIIAGLFALAYPLQALRLLVFVGGGILVLDGILNMAALRLTGPRDLSFWIGIARSVLAILAGLMVLCSPWLIPMLSVGTLRILVGIQAIILGMLEVCTLLLPRAKARDGLWSTLISGGAYALFGLALIALPVDNAVILVQVIAVLMVVFALSLLVGVWRQRAAVNAMD
ncbi:Uncharacterized membrane protein HdeD, DUF308 family [Devosia sp. YR412]|uniref:DUF308 domain-containing protein n=1 Tax=Devosia sp. YR412 TaxID=1881030 RepID=UPI0008AB1E7F|nr:DUF308 domain-containing protein [Devosia sp. YR412]SEQ41310.1 Uncharacterized membrane protein HdeD, DUF308 family [Devosia sp. YR412]